MYFWTQKRALARSVRVPFAVAAVNAICPSLSPTGSCAGDMAIQAARKNRNIGTYELTSKAVEVLVLVHDVETLLLIGARSRAVGKFTAVSV